MQQLKYSLIYFLSLAYAFHSFAQQKNAIEGTVVDRETGESLAYASIGFENIPLGTVSNAYGDFRFQFPDSLNNHPLVISFVGYESYTIIPSNIPGKVNVKLKPIAMQLDEVVVRPLSPEEYIKRVVRNIPNAYASEEYESLAYYQALFQENDEIIRFDEYVFQAYNPSAADTSKNQYQLALFREADQGQIQFMRDRRDMKKEKRRLKAEKKGKELPPDSTNQEIFNLNLGGPDMILSLGVEQNLDAFLDSTQFKHIKYKFGPAVYFQDKELLNIHFESRRTVDHLKFEGNLYIDLETDAITYLEFDGDFIMPLWARPILFTAGFSVHEPTFKKTIRYQLQNGRWYPEYYFMYLSGELEKRNLFKKNELSDFEITSFMKVNELHFDEISPIEKDKRFNPDKKPKDQVYAIPGIEWSEINTVQ